MKRFTLTLLIAIITLASLDAFGQSKKQYDMGELAQNRGFALADGYYCYEGVWKSDRYQAQPCFIEFTKRGSRITGRYTNEYWHSSFDLTGTLKGSTLRLTGYRKGKKLVITLPLSRGLWRLTGTGTHGVDRATIPLERIR